MGLESGLGLDLGLWLGLGVPRASLREGQRVRGCVAIILRVWTAAWLTAAGLGACDLSRVENKTGGGVVVVRNSHPHLRRRVLRYEQQRAVEKQLARQIKQLVPPRVHLSRKTQLSHALLLGSWGRTASLGESAVTPVDCSMPGHCLTQRLRCSCHRCHDETS